LEQETLINILKKLSVYNQVVAYLGRMNIWEDLLYYLLEQDVRSADQFSDEEFVKTL